jgi:hypothetical protein
MVGFGENGTVIVFILMVLVGTKQEMPLKHLLLFKPR